MSKKSYRDDIITGINKQESTEGVMRRFKSSAVCMFLSCIGMLAGDLPLDMASKLVVILTKGVNSPGKIMVKDASMKDEFAKVGLSNSDDAPIAWASSEGEVKSMKGHGKIVVCGKTSWLNSGGCIAIIEEDGKPQIYLHLANISASGVQVSDSIMKVGKKIQ